MNAQTVYVLSRTFHGSWGEGSNFEVFGVYANLEDARTAAVNCGERDFAVDDFPPEKEAYKPDVKARGWSDDDMSFVVTGEYDTVSYDIEPCILWHTPEVKR